MRVSRVYIDEPLASGQNLQLDRDLSHYLGTVLRLKSGSDVRVFNGEDGEFLAGVSAQSRQGLELAIKDKLAEPETPRLQLHLLLGLTRGDRMDFAIQKSTELGVTRISPFFSEFGEVRFKQSSRLDKRMQHWQRVAISACEQCGRIVPPVLNAPGNYVDVLRSCGDTTGVVLDPSGAPTLSTLGAADELCLVTGPEGGFSELELELARQAGFHVASLGPRILRAETAPLAAMAILQNRFGDLI
jgi:16S rRNA (uracil1498-N3)-methyltransferase